MCVIPQPPKINVMFMNSRKIQQLQTKKNRSEFGCQDVNRLQKAAVGGVLCTSRVRPTKSQNEPLTLQIPPNTWLQIPLSRAAVTN